MAKVKFNFVINKQANHYFFVQNLAEWHFSNRPKYNEIWIQKIGSLSKKEKASLNELEKIRKRYPESKSIFEKSFFLTEKPYENLEKELTKKEIQGVKKTMTLFENKFEVIFNEDLKLLEKWAEILRKGANNSARNQKVVEKLEIFYKSPLKTDKTVTCYLLLNPEKISLGGGANIDKESITTELSHFSFQHADYVSSHKWHETVHLVFEGDYFIPFLKKYLKNDSERVSMLKELINSSFFPRGILGNEIFKQKLAGSLYYRFPTSKNQTEQILSLSKDYLDNKKNIDIEYLDKLSLYLKNG